MKILWLIPDIGHNHYGRMAAIADRTGVKLHVAEVFNDSGFKEFGYSGQIEPHIEVTRLGLSKAAQKNSRSGISTVLFDIFSQARPDVVCIPGWGEWYALATLKAAKKTGIPTIIFSDSTADDAPRFWLKELIKRRIVGTCSSALVAGRRHVEYITALGMSPRVVSTGYDVVDNAYFSTQSDLARSLACAQKQEQGLPENYFLASNRFIQKKNLPRLLEAYAAYVSKVGDDAWHLVLLGDGPLKAALTDLIVHLGMVDKVLLPGFRQYHELPIYYGLASAFIHSSTSEQWGLVVNEAMASGLPVLVSDRCGCAPDLVRNGVNGFTFDPYNVEEMTGCMLELSHGEHDVVAMGRASRDIIRNWSPETFAENMLKAAQAAIDAPRAKASWLDRALLYALARR